MSLLPKQAIRHYTSDVKPVVWKALQQALGSAGAVQGALRTALRTGAAEALQRHCRRRRLAARPAPAALGRV